MTIEKQALTADYTPRHAVEKFRLLTAAWDIAKAWQMVQAWTPEERAARLMRRKLPLSMLEQVWIDEALAMSDKVDLSVPLLLGQFQNRHSVGCMVLDGWHRVYKASRTRKRTLPAFILTIEETKAIEVKG